MKIGKHLFNKKSSMLAAIALASLSFAQKANALLLASNVDPTNWIFYDNNDANGNPHTIPGFPTPWQRSVPILIPAGTTQIQFSITGNEVTNPNDPPPHAEFVSADGFVDNSGAQSTGATAGALAGAYPGFTSGASSYGLFTIAPGNEAVPTGNPARSPFVGAVSYIDNGLDGALYGVFFQPNAPLPPQASGAASRSLLEYSSLTINEPFFIGDGLTADNFNGSTNGAVQTFDLPSGTVGPVYLLLGLGADPNVIDNEGNFKVNIFTPGPIPEPSTWLFGMALVGVIGKMSFGMWRCRHLLRA